MRTIKLKADRWGNSIGLLIPLNVAAIIGLQANTRVVAMYQANEIHVNPIPQYDRTTLLAEVTHSNLPQDDWGMLLADHPDEVEHEE